MTGMVMQQGNGIELLAELGYRRIIDTEENRLIRVCQEFCVNFLEIFVIFFHQWAQPFIDEQLVPDHCPIGQAV